MNFNGLSFLEFFFFMVVFGHGLDLTISEVICRNILL